MPAVIDPDTQLQLIELSHPWGHFTPIHPGHPDLRIERVVNHARHGAMTQRIGGVMHASTHVNAPIHLIAGAATVAQLPLDRFFGNGVVWSVPKARWGLVTADDLERAEPAPQAGDIAVIVTGWHVHYADSQAYFGHAPGLAGDAADWLIERGIKLVAVDTPQIDHPMATSLAGHRNGPIVKGLARAYEDATGRRALDDHPQWNVAHRKLLAVGIPTIENVGGDVAEITGRRVTFHACPWRWTEGDACVVRFVAIIDPSGRFRLAA